MNPSDSKKQNNNGLFVIDGEETGTPCEWDLIDTRKGIAKLHGQFGYKGKPRWPIWIRIDPERLPKCDYIEIKISSRGRVDVTPVTTILPDEIKVEKP